jgi:hypothetical protein
LSRGHAETARNKLRLDLFDRRFAVFEAAMTLASARREFLVATKTVPFLFNQELADYCDALAKEAISVMVGKIMMESLPQGERHQQSVEAWADGMKWFNDQLGEIQKRFAPFLHISG